MQWSSSWIRGHADKKPWKDLSDLRNQDLSRDEIYNVWCNHMAQQEWDDGSASLLDPDTTPSERWSLFAIHPQHHKITSKLKTGFYATIGYENLAQYISNKHSTSQAKLDRVNTAALSIFLGSKKIHKRANIVKLIHKWAPTFSTLCRQGCEASAICPRCHLAIETFDHVYTCSNEQAIIT